MPVIEATAAPWIVRRVFPGWSVTIPSDLTEPPTGEEPYWHAFDATHSVSLTGLAVTEDDGPVPAVAIARRAFLLLPRGGRVQEGPVGLLAQARLVDTEPPARASRAVQGMVAAEGRLLAATITSDDLDWARRVWRSIVHHDVPPVTRRGRDLALCAPHRPTRRRRR